MLRELNENEMEMVSGGTGYGTKGKSGDAKYSVANRDVANMIDEMRGLDAQFGRMAHGMDASGSGSVTISDGATSNEKSTAKKDDKCISVPMGYNSHSEYEAHLQSFEPGGRGSGQAGASGGAGAKDLWNFFHGCKND